MSRPLTQADRDSIVELIIAAARRTLLPDAGVTLSGQPVRSFLAGPAPTNLFSKLQWDIGRETCRRWAAGKSVSILPQREAFLRDTCSPYISAAFGTIGTASAEPAVPGGQCAGVAYSFDITRVDPNGVNLGNQSISCAALWYGPMGTFRETVSASSENVGITGFFASGLPRKSTILSGGPGSRITLINFARCDGLADSCGTKPVTISPGPTSTGVPAPAPLPSPPGFPWPFPPVNISLNPDGTINISFGDGTAPITIDPGTDPSFPSLPPPGGGTAGSPVGTGVGGEAAGDAPSGQMLWGIKVTITTAPANANQFSPGIYRGVCYVYMGDENGLDNDMAGATMASGQMVLAERDYLTKWRVVANDGYNLSITPYYKNTEA